MTYDKNMTYDEYLNFVNGQPDLNKLSLAERSEENLRHTFTTMNELARSAKLADKADWYEDYLAMAQAIRDELDRRGLPSLDPEPVLSDRYRNVKDATISYCYRPAIEQIARAEHAGDRARRAELLADLNLMRAEWIRRGNAALDGDAGWPKWNPTQWEAERARLQQRLEKSGGWLPEVKARAVLAQHMREGSALGYVAA